MKVGKITALLICILLLLSACSSSPDKETAAMNKSFFAMNTYNTITVYGDIPEDVLEIAEQELKNLESLWSVTDEYSEIYAVNHANGVAVTVSDDTADLLKFALDMCRQTDGALDITLYPVLTAWGFTTGSYQVPSEEELGQKMQYVGFDKASLTGNTLTLLPGMEIDLGAVAKGYACDLITEDLRANGVTSGIISLGGNIQAIGSKPDGSDFRISVQHPDHGDSLGILSLSDFSVVTSGAYERYFEDENGKRYGHILDAHTGYPAESGLKSVTIVGKESKLCDALSTALFTMGLEKAEQYWKTNGGFDMLLVTESGEVYLTEGLEEHFSLAKAYEDLPLYVIQP